MFLRPQRIITSMLVMVVALVSSFAIRPAQAQDAYCFSETGYCISGRFRHYWEQNGGLAVFGFPIGPARDEPNPDTGKTYLTQWFERNRFELHPENPAPYDILLGRLGDDRLKQIGRDWRAQGRESNRLTGCRWFEETGHQVCDQGDGAGFKTYWETHGLADPRLDGYQRSLALFGLPLTTPRMETNSSGDNVLTQWFERARFEWHPDKPAPFKVLLGRLGDEIARSQGGERPTGRIVYVSAQDGSPGGDLYIMNADGTGQTRLTSAGAIQLGTGDTAVSPAGDRVAYRAGGTLYVVGLDGTGQQVVATTEIFDPNPFEIFAPTWAPDGSYLAYVWKRDIYATRLDGSPPVQITKAGEVSSPACLSWARNGYLSFRTPARHTFKLWVVRSDGSDARQIAWGLCGTLSPAGDRMVYMNGGLWLVNLDGSNMHPMTSGRTFLRGVWSPDGTRVAGVAYSSEQPDDRHLFVVDPATRETRQLTTGLVVDALPSWSPDGKFITFAAKRDGRSSVYVIRADGSGLTRLAMPEESAAPRWVGR